MYPKLIKSLGENFSKPEATFQNSYSFIQLLHFEEIILNTENNTSIRPFNALHLS